MPDSSGPKQNSERHSPASRFAGRAFVEYASGLHRYLALRLRNSEDVRDLAQEVFLRLLRFNKREFVEQPQAYLYRVAYHVLCDFRGREAHELVNFDSESYEQSAVEAADHSPAPEEAYDQRVRQMRLERALETLPPMQRAVFLMQKREGHSYAETAQALGLSVKTVKTYLFRAVCHCREAISDEYESRGENQS